MWVWFDAYQVSKSGTPFSRKVLFASKKCRETTRICA